MAAEDKFEESVCTRKGCDLMNFSFTDFFFISSVNDTEIVITYSLFQQCSCKSFGRFHTRTRDA